MTTYSIYASTLNGSKVKGNELSFLLNKKKIETQTISGSMQISEISNIVSDRLLNKIKEQLELKK